ncbi:MAG: hypothetical protein LBT04_09485 [Prevotellaceae bacterium]|jgi:hypothetical protein|nr:hypothetical protein [Prevotellaceae bacterium]
MKKITNNKKRVTVLVFALLLLPCTLFAQGTAPSWFEGDVRSVQYPQNEYYTGFAQISVASTGNVTNATNRAKQIAIGELSDRVRVLVETEKKSIDVSYSGSNIEEQIFSKFQLEIKTASQTEVVGSNVSTYLNPKDNSIYAFAFVKRTDLIAYYQKQITLNLNKIDGALQTASELVEKGYKMKARRQCEIAVPFFAKVAYAQDLLTAVDGSADDNTLLQRRSERLRNTLIQTITDLENSTFVYVECNETVNGQNVVHIADRLPGLLTEGGCQCSIVEMEEEADYIIKVNASLARCNDAPDNIVFCYANATVSVYNARTQKMQMPKIAETKGGWTNKNRAKATEEAFDGLTDKIVEKVIPMIKN